MEQSRSFLPGSPPSSHENSVDSGRSSSEQILANRVFVRGRAPFGTGKECRINVKEYETCDKEIKNMLPFDCQRHVFIDQPVPRKFQISYRVVGGTDKCHDVCATLRTKIDEKQYQIRGKELKISAQMSPSRRAALSSFYTALRHVDTKVANKEAYGHSIKAMEIFTEPDADTLGKWDKDSTTWKWCSEKCLALNIPELSIREIQES